MTNPIYDDIDFYLTGSDEPSGETNLVPIFVADALSSIVPVDVTGTVWAVSTSNAGNGEVNLQSAEYTQVGNLRYYRLLLSAREDSPYSIGVTNAKELIPTYHQHFRLGAGDYAAGQATFSRVGSNEIQIDRDDNIDVLCRVDLWFIAVM